MQGGRNRMNDDVKEFVNHHQIRVLDTNKRAYKHSRLSTEVRYFDFSDDYNKMTAVDAMRFETEPLYTIEICESELERIAKFENEVFNNMKQQGHYNLFEQIMGLKEEEYKMREQYPAVRKAYQQYSLMLKLAQSGEL